MKQSQNSNGFVAITIIVILLFLALIGYFFLENTKSEPENNFPGKIVANKVEDYTVNPQNNTVYYFTTRKGADSYNEIVTLFKTNDENTLKIDEFTIGGGLVNAEAKMFVSVDAVALFIQNINLPDSDKNITALCRQYAFVNTEVQKKDTYSYEYNPSSDDCKEVFAESNAIISDGPYSDTSYNSQIENFFEFGGSIKYEQYKCPGIDTCDYRTILTIGQESFTQEGTYQLSLNRHQVDANNNLIISVNKTLYKIPLK